MDDEEARRRLLAAAEKLFYARGVQAVGMDEIRAESEVPLKRLYRVFPAKADLVAAYLEARDLRWNAALAAAVDAAGPDPHARLDAAFDWLATWFSEPDFRGCAFVNVYGELGPAVPTVETIVRNHKAQLRALLGDVAADLDAGPDVPDQLMLLAEGAIVVASMSPGPAPARSAKQAARTLVQAAT